MSSYLEAYGAAEEKRVRKVRALKIYGLALASALIAGLILYAVFKNYGEKQRAKQFVSLLQAGNYPAAYQLWGCSEAQPCRDYPFSKFLDDWGPKSAHANSGTAHIGLAQSCGTGVLIRLDYQGSVEPVPIWVERDSRTISFAPWAECPGRHLHIGAWLKSVFGR